MDQNKSLLEEPQERLANPLDGLGLGIFAMLAGALLLAERLGWISEDLNWGFPLVLIVFGIMVVMRYVLARR